MARNGKKLPIIEAIQVTDNNFSSAIEVHALAHMLLLFGLGWHGLYNRDYKFIFDNQKLASVIQVTNEVDIGNIPEVFKIPGGMRIEKQKGSIKASMLAFFPDYKIIDTIIEIDPGGTVMASTQDVYITKTHVYLY